MIEVVSKQEDIQLWKWTRILDPSQYGDFHILGDLLGIIKYQCPTPTRMYYFPEQYMKYMSNKTFWYYVADVMYPEWYDFCMRKGNLIDFFTCKQNQQDVIENTTKILNGICGYEKSPNDDYKFFNKLKDYIYANTHYYEFSNGNFYKGYG